MLERGREKKCWERGDIGGDSPPIGKNYCEVGIPHQDEKCGSGVANNQKSKAAN